MVAAKFWIHVWGQKVDQNLPGKKSRPKKVDPKFGGHSAHISAQHFCENRYGNINPICLGVSCGPFDKKIGSKNWRKCSQVPGGGGDGGAAPRWAGCSDNFTHRR